VRAFLKSEKDFTLASIAVVLVVLGLLLVSFTGRGFAPFVYAGF
jgi:competence protein ComGC